ncbi:MAG: DUF4148 domain-containing protein [Paraburkholderia sp.]|uniref:DUF4148 domain-containing protein n=1 Tax=Paraburkholderia sp. TaxID=1926495 RepID=UPI003C5024DE
MKNSIIALAFAAFATVGVAHAANVTADQQDAAQTQQWSASQSGAMQKTRAQVRQELVEAQKDGQLAALRKLYQGA